MRLSRSKVVGFQNRSHQFGLAFEDFVKHLLVVYVVTSALTCHDNGTTLNLLLRDGLDLQSFAEFVQFCRVNIVLQLILIFLVILPLAVEKVLT